MTVDEFAEFDGAYVLGALSEAERLAFEAHLLGCAGCREQVHQLAELPALLALVPAEAFTAASRLSPDPVVALLATARARRNRRRWLTATAGFVAAACLVLLTVIIVHPHSNSPQAAVQPVTMTALVPASIHATAAVRSVSWGTSIQLRCTYDGSGSYGSGVYTLIVQSRTGETDTLGTWDVVPGKITTFTSGTALELADIKTITIGTPTGVSILQLTY